VNWKRYLQCWPQKKRSWKSSQEELGEDSETKGTGGTIKGKRRSFRWSRISSPSPKNFLRQSRDDRNKTENFQGGGGESGGEEPGGKGKMKQMWRYRECNEGLQNFGGWCWQLGVLLSLPGCGGTGRGAKKRGETPRASCKGKAAYRNKKLEDETNHGRCTVNPRGKTIRGKRKRW